MKELVVATMNQGKLREIKSLLKDIPLKITSLVDYPEAPDIIENGDSFRANAMIKAQTIAQYTQKLTLGEDSGLEVRALNNAPGIYSARFSGEGATDEKNNLKLIADLQGIPLEQRQARYRCYVIVFEGSQIVGEADGRCEGLIALTAKGNNGFGYDPYFFLPQYNKTFGELDPQIKATISHRAKAFQTIKVSLEEYCQDYLK